MSLHQLVYISQSTKKMSSSELDAILATAKRNNGNMDVTGSLFYNGGWFLQVLEGSKEQIDTLYQKIEKDPRHKNSRLLYLEPAKARTFSRWTMNMVNLDNRQSDKFDDLKAIIDEAKQSSTTNARSPAVKLLKRFAA